MIDTTTCERPWCLYDVGDETKLNEDHPLITRLTADERAELLYHIEEFEHDMRYLDYDWLDLSNPENERWQCPLELVVNNWVLAWIETNRPEWLGATVDGVLTSAGLAPEALACLDEDDQQIAAALLAISATEALKHGRAMTESLRMSLIGWLQEWTETDERDLATLVGITQSMSSPRQQEDSVNWSEEGF